MTTFKINYGFERVYANNGQHQEQAVRFTLTGEIVKADNLPHDLGADVLNYQVKGKSLTLQGVRR